MCLKLWCPLDVFRFTNDKKTFIDVNGDKYLDAYELEAIFQYELDKIYDPEKVSLVSIGCSKRDSTF